MLSRNGQNIHATLPFLESMPSLPKRGSYSHFIKSNGSFTLPSPRSAFPTVVDAIADISASMNTTTQSRGHLQGQEPDRDFLAIFLPSAPQNFYEPHRRVSQ